MRAISKRSREDNLLAILLFLVFALFIKILLMTVYEYRFYFPADFDSMFLTGRKAYFEGAYARVFYIHIVSGPIALVLGALLMFSGVRSSFLNAHNYVGKIQMIIVIGLVAPTGFFMSLYAFTGPIAGWGFLLLSLTTTGTAVAAIYFAIRKKFAEHWQWATRCFLCLCSPLLLRLFNGTMIMTELESELTYRLSAWLSWIVPLAIYELVRIGANAQDEYTMNSMKER